MTLNQRQRKALELLLAGLSDKEIARELEMNLSTTGDFICQLRKKLGGGTRAKIMATYMRPTAEAVRLINGEQL
jgi:DNA-binding NarL/FixJ family response regulator